MHQHAVGFIADLHLSPEQPQIMRLFTQFLSDPPPITTLYILGDLFEYWIGDDACDEGYDEVIEALTKASANGLEIAIMHGNRDFLMGNDLAQRCGCRLIKNDSVVSIDNQRVLITHGDLLCSDDADYLQLYNTIRTDNWKKQFLSHPISKRKEFAENLRVKSRQEIAKKSYSDLDVNQQTVEALMEKYQVQILIHGHTHKQNIHRFTNSQQLPCQRYVLGDWKSHQGNVLVFKNGTGEFLDIS